MKKIASSLAALGALLLAPGLLQSATAPFSLRVVPPLSPIPRLPDSVPSDALPEGSELRIVAAQGEFEPASFLIVPHANVAKLELQASDLTGPGGKIPAADVDIKIVKAWYQAGTAWFSYFGDANRRELVPELLLNDETLVRVDHQTKDNYLRVGGEYQSVSYPKEKAEKAFNYLTAPVADSKTLQPIALQKGENKQIWVTVRVPKNTPGGVYQGRINLVADGKPAGAMPIGVRVLPFELPLPKTYYSLENDYLVTMYGTGMLALADRLKIPREVSEKQQRAIYKNLVEHNVFNGRMDSDIRSQDPEGDVERIKRDLELMKEAGFVMKPLITSGWSYPLPHQENDFEAFKTRMSLLAKTLKDSVGHSDIYVTSWDEAGPDRIKVMREFTEFTNTLGLKLWVTTAEGKHYDLAGYIIDYANHGGWPQRELVDKWHAVGAKVASYAGPHTGPENPDVFRRWEGLARYKAHYDGSYNYKYYSQLHPTLFEQQKANVWNDYIAGAFRGFNLVYPTADGVVDTLAWEGYREGIDDVRYATKLKQEAAAAIASGKPAAAHAAKKALMRLELMDAKTADLSEARQEIIESILNVQAAAQAP